MHIIKDTREQQGWGFDMYNDVESVTVDTVWPGDYTLKGFEDIFVIERKANTGELAMNLGKKKSQFEKELKAMKELTYKYIVCEFPMSDFEIFPKNSGIPKRYWNRLRVTGRYLQSTLFSLANKYDIELHFCDDQFGACEKAMEIFQEVIEYERL